jgi:hypothetical protein
LKEKRRQIKKIISQNSISFQVAGLTPAPANGGGGYGNMDDDEDTGYGGGGYKAPPREVRIAYITLQ